MPSLNIPLKTALIATGKKQKRIAKLLRMSEVELSKIVRGHRPASEDTRRRLAEFLGRNESELFPGVEESRIAS
jgi:transcriptional regulator with XRE-family HTH domain